jgi:hypothetical protein
VFEKAGIVVTSSNRAEVDRAIRGIVGSNYKDCPAIWKQIKQRIANDEATFVSELKQAWSNRQKQT